MSEIALIGKKIGMTREFYKSGQLVPVTVLKMEKARVIQVIDEDKVISFECFKKKVFSISNMMSKTKKFKVKINEKRLGWYYQQVLKLTFEFFES